MSLPVRLAALVLALALLPLPLAAQERLRVAAWDAGLSGKGPGRLLAALEAGGKRRNPRVDAALEVIARLAPDILLLTGIDHDRDGQTRAAFSRALARAGHPMPHHFAGWQNQGIPSGRDLDGDGRAGEPEDALGYGRYPGDDGMALFSRLPILAAEARDFAGLNWHAQGWAPVPRNPDGSAFFSPEAQAVLPLAERGLWAVPVALPQGGRLWVFAGYGGPPVFDGPEDRNGTRSAAHAAFWLRALDGAPLTDSTGRTAPLPGADFVLMGNFGLDPRAGDGDRAAMARLLAHRALQDTHPRGAWGRATVRYRQRDGGVLALRTTHVLPARGLEVLATGVGLGTGSDADAGGTSGSAAEDLLAAASRHRPVWVDIALPAPAM